MCEYARDVLCEGSVEHCILMSDEWPDQEMPMSNETLVYEPGVFGFTIKEAEIESMWVPVEIVLAVKDG